MNIFRWFRNQTGVRPKRVLPVERPALVFKSRHGETYPIEESPPHADPLAEYEDAEGNCYAQRAERFLDGRFWELPH